MNDLVIKDFSDINRAAEMFVKSGLFKDVRQAQTAGVLIMAGIELGIGPMAAIKGLQIIQGKVVMSAGLMATLVKRSTKYNYRIVPESGDTQCTLEWFENGESVGNSNFTMEEAKAAGLAGKDVWKKYASDMLFARALTRGVRRYAPDVLGGDTYVQGEIESNEPINVTPKVEVVQPDPVRIAVIERVKSLIKGMDDDSRQSVKNKYMELTKKDFPGKNWQGLPTDQLELLAGMLNKKHNEEPADTTGYRVVEDALDSIAPKDKLAIKTMFENAFGDWVDVKKMDSEQLAQMEGWLNMELAV